MEGKKLSVRDLALSGILTALVILLQLLANYVQPVPGVSITLVLVPIVIGAALLGPPVGVWLGLVFGSVVMITGGANAFFAISVPGTVIVCLAKGALAGLCVSVVYRLLRKFNDYFAIVCAAVVCPIVNTGVFLIGCRLFFFEGIKQWQTASSFQSTAAFMLIGLAGVNFLIELAINCVLAPVILRLTRIGNKTLHHS